jgi:hypothetical protein
MIATAWVLNRLAYGYAKNAADVVGQLTRARVPVTREEVETRLLELAEARQIEAAGSGWRRR